MNKDDFFKLPRLFTTHPLTSNGVIPLDKGQAHYLHNVLRRKEGDFVRLFDGQNGEWIGALQNIGKKGGDVYLEEQLFQQPENKRRIHLVFSPIKKHRMDWLIEKAVELGATDFHPIITQNTEVRKINEERLNQQIFEAAEQCERFIIPALHPLQKLENLLTGWSNDVPLLSCIERFDTKPLQDIDLTNTTDTALLIGPEGGFTKEEKELVAKHSTAVSLGETILRCETAVVKALILIER